MCAQSVLAISALAAQAHIDVVLPTGSVSPVSLALLTVADSGERKSATDKLLSGGVDAYERMLADEHDIRRPIYESQKGIWDIKMKKALRSATGLTDPAVSSLLSQRPLPPREPMITVPDATIDGIIRLLRNGQSSVGLFSDEAGSFIGGYGMSKDRQLLTAAQLSKMWDGAPIRRANGNSGTISLPGRRLSIHLMSQPSAASTWLNNPVLRDQGLFSRMLLAAPEPRAGVRAYKEADRYAHDQVKQFHSSIEERLRLAPNYRGQSRDELAPRALEMSAKAKSCWWDIYDQIESEVGPGGKFECVRPLANKTLEHAARIAAVTAFMRDPNVKVLEFHDIYDGAAVAHWYLNEAVRITKNALVPDKISKAMTLLDWIQKSWPLITSSGANLISLPDVYMYGPYILRNKSDAEESVNVLIDHGWLMRSHNTTLVNGMKRRKDVFIVSPDPNLPAGVS